MTVMDPSFMSTSQTVRASNLFILALVSRPSGTRKSVLKSVCMYIFAQADDNVTILETISKLEHLPTEKREAELRRLAADADDAIANGDFKAAELALAAADELKKLEDMADGEL